VSELDTPALLIDLDLMESNIAALFTEAAAAGVSVRPHLKTDKTPVLAHRLLGAGVLGMGGRASLIAASGNGGKEHAATGRIRIERTEEAMMTTIKAINQCVRGSSKSDKPCMIIGVEVQNPGLPATEVGYR
jgi:hypothetical protein